MARFGLVTGGGDCPGLNAVIRAVVKRALSGGHEVIGIERAFHGLFDPGGTRLLTLDSVSGILPRGGTILGTSNRSNPFHFPVNENGAIVERDVSDEVLRRIAELRLEGVVMIGGDGSMAIAQQLIPRGLRVIGVPKTIDNDLAGTDQTFGFDTARNIATEAIDRLHTTAEAHDRVMVLEVMGRDAGFIALESGIAGGADIILVPEIPWRLLPIVEAVARRKQRGRSFSIAVVAEGARPTGAAQAILEAANAVPGRGMVRLGGAGQVLADALGREIDLEVRVDVLGHLQRGGSPSAYDRLLGTRVGYHAVTLIEEGRWNELVVLRGANVSSIPIGAGTTTRCLDVHSELVALARGLGITLGE